MRKPLQIVLACLLLAIGAIVAGMIGFRFAQWKVDGRELPGKIGTGETVPHPIEEEASQPEESDSEPL